MISQNSLEKHDQAQSKSKETKCLKNDEHTSSEALASELCYRASSCMHRRPEDRLLIRRNGNFADSVTVISSSSNYMLVMLADFYFLFYAEIKMKRIGRYPGFLLEGARKWIVFSKMLLSEKSYCK